MYDDVTGEEGESERAPSARAPALNQSRSVLHPQEKVHHAPRPHTRRVVVNMYTHTP